MRLCYAMLCYDMICHAMLCSHYHHNITTMLCHAMPCYAMPCYAMLIIIMYITCDCAPVMSPVIAETSTAVSADCIPSWGTKHKNAPLFLSAFPMIVPSLSWKVLIC